MKNQNYNKIFFGLALMVVMFFSLLIIPKITRLITHFDNANAAATGTTIYNHEFFLNPPSGPVNTTVVLSGSGFTPTNNTIIFNGYPIATVDTQDDGTLEFTVPASLRNCTSNVCSDVIVGVTPGNYPVTVTNSNGTSSSSIIFTVTDQNSGGTGTTTPTGPVHTCSGTANCIQGAKVPYGGVADLQQVSLDNHRATTTQTFAYDNLSSGIHTISVTTPPDYYVGFTVCINSVSCHDNAPIQGDSVSINFRTNNSSPTETNGLISVPAGSYVDVYWHYSQNYDLFTSAPPGLDSNNGNLSTPPTTSGSSQADAYTGGNTGGGGAGSGFQNAATSALGCALSNIISSSIKGAISNTLKNKIGGLLNSIQTGQLVPTNESGQLKIDAQQLRGNSDVTKTAQIGSSALGGAISGPSWDAIAYCLQNTMLKYIQQQTLQWMNTAFNGNPAFVQNLNQFLVGIENQQAMSFFNRLKGMNPNSPIQQKIYQGAVVGYNSGYAQQSQYTLNQYSSNPTGFTNGNWSQGGSAAFMAAFQPANFPAMAQNMAMQQLALETNTAVSQETTKYIANNGTLDSKNCSGGSGGSTIIGRTSTGEPVYSAPVVDKGPLSTNCKTIVTGNMANSKFAANTNAPIQRLATNSGKFDQTVDMLVNALITTALSNIFGHH